MNQTTDLLLQAIEVHFGQGDSQKKDLATALLTEERLSADHRAELLAEILSSTEACFCVPGNEIGVYCDIADRHVHIKERVVAKE